MFPDHSSLRIVLTSECNYDCSFCHKDMISQGDVNFDELLNILSFYKGRFHRIILTGGEPLLYYKIYDIVRILKRLFPNSRIGITTNGSIFNERVFSILDEIHVSFHTFDEVKYKEITHADFQRAYQNLNKLLSKHREKVRINKLVFDISELPKYLERAYELGVNYVSLYTIVNSLKFNSVESTSLLFKWADKHLLFIKQIPRGRIYTFKDKINIIIKGQVFTRMCQNCPLKNHCEGKCGIRLTPDLFFSVCPYGIYSPLDAKDDISFNDLMHYYLNGEVPNRYKGLEIEGKYKSHVNALFTLSKRTMRDAYFTSGSFKHGVDYLRVRTVNNKSSLEYSRVKYLNGKKVTEEYEVDVSDGILTERLLNNLPGFSKDVVIEKVRRKVIVKRGEEYFTLIVDDVKGLGKFVEVEALSHRYLKKVEKALNLGEKINAGYPDLIKVSNSQNTHNH